MFRSLALLAGAAPLFAVTFAATPVRADTEKVGVCHLGGNGHYVYVEVPEKQFHFTRKFNLPGHAHHTATGHDLLGLTREECLARNK